MSGSESGSGSGRQTGYRKYENAEAPFQDTSNSTSIVKESPQATIDKFWTKFSTKYPGTVHSVLPSDIFAKKKATKTRKGSVQGKGAVKSYDDAANECKRAVERIARECRRVNKKYRDQHFDIEYDLKAWPYTRNCLDGLGYIAERRYPKAVKRVPDIFEKPEFFIEGATASDVRQGNTGDCWFLSALTAISNKTTLIDRVCVARDEVVGVYGFVFHRDGEWCHTVVDDKLYLTAPDWWESHSNEKQYFEDVHRFQAHEAENSYRKSFQRGSKSLFFAQCREENETWLPLMEKAYAKAHGDYSAIEGGFAGEAVEDLTGGVTTEIFTPDILDKEYFWNNEISKVNDEFLFSCFTGTFDKWLGSDSGDKDGARLGIVRQHAYSIMEAVEIKGQRLLKIRNPWGTDEWRGAWSDGSEQWNSEWLELLDHKFGDDGMFWISFADLIEKYSVFERTRLFDQSWSIAQQWTSVDVPWSADYNDTKFMITLTKTSPIVIVLSQLDNRYWRGLEGQYDFKLHYRLDKDGEEDYIVRSYSNYFMGRSVSTDLVLEPGTYSVLMKITAKRNSALTTPASIVRDNCKIRPNKLIQIGLSYDLAFAKGDIKETEEEKQNRAALDVKKQEARRIKQRAEVSAKQRKDWETEKRERARKKRRDQKRKDYRLEKEGKAKLKDSGEDPGKVKSEKEIEGNDKNGNEMVVVERPKEGKEESGKADKEAVKQQSPETTPPEGTSQVNDRDSNDDTEAAQGQSKTNQTVDTDAPQEQAKEDQPDVAEADDKDDYLYDSDASFESSIDSVLDLDEDVPATDQSAAGTADATNDEDPEIENDPWNACCIVGLRVYNKDSGCSIKVVRPRSGEDKAGLEVDDVSKSVSEEKQTSAGGDGSVKTEVKLGVE
ncbi:uncharacterized protein KY384_002664 [Bacidia gigantensis]|uniref:uncharacterized protein n=1 Tax=Bacidia gigantensis TaxID=2732470 RepID=UPI001D045DD6|nr:uncharacterized protein KY384_002664 [Bacidia gigantensis]KAG8532786.1 hypothetical protein KY384_002664 [Bacidia gigantensis]